MKYGRRTTSVARQQAAKELADKNESDFTDWLPLLGTAAGAALAVPTLGLSALPLGASVGATLGESAGLLSAGTDEPAKMGRGAAGLARLASDEKSSEIIKRVLQGWK